MTFFERNPTPPPPRCPPGAPPVPPRALSDDGSRLFFESLKRSCRATPTAATTSMSGSAPQARKPARRDRRRTVSGRRRRLPQPDLLRAIGPGLALPRRRSLRGERVHQHRPEPPAPRPRPARRLRRPRGGGFAPPSGPAAECEGEACQSPPGAPNAATPASAAFRGAGNTVPARDCSSLARRLRRLAHHNRAVRVRGRALARRAHRAGDSAHGRRLARRAHRLSKASRRRAKAARRLAGRAKRCRRANRRAAR